MPEVALLTLFAIDSGEQQHFLMTDCAPPERLVAWLGRSMHEISPGSRPTSLEHLRHCILQAGGQPLEGSEDGRCLRKHLITHLSKAPKASHLVLVSPGGLQPLAKGMAAKAVAAS